MYDIHSHIIPGIDDGADSDGDSVQMLRLAAEGGTLGIVCTPHCNIPDTYANYYGEDLKNRIEGLRRLSASHGIKIEIYQGQEVFLAGAVLRLLREGKIITVNRTQYLLCEFHPNEHPDSAVMKIESICAEGYVPIVAHPERYRFVNEIPEAADRLKKSGAFLQIDKGSLKGAFGTAAERTAHRLIAERMADFVASDAHSPYVRTPYLEDVEEMIGEMYSMNYSKFLLSDNPLRVISGEKLYKY